MLKIVYYDNYSFLGYSGWDAEGHSFAFVSEQGSTTYNSRIVGLVTGSKSRIVAANTWLNAVQYYDDHYRPLQAIAENHLNGLDRVTAKYNSLRELSEIKKTHVGNETVTVINKFNYDHAGRIIKIYQNVNGTASDQLVVQYEYNELGQPVDKKLHNVSGTTFLQSIDYRYNIRGWITSINNAQLNVNTADNDDTNDLFGMEFLYTTTDAGLSNTKYYNGNISAIKWKGPDDGSGTTNQRSYKYTYDKSDRLLAATSQMYNGSSWTKETNALNESLTYDHNGNIKTLLRNHRKHQLSGVTPSYVQETVDNLTYTYSATQGNQITKIEDAVGVSDGTGDFKNNVNITTEYTYNGDGSVTADKNKGIDSVHYDILGKVRRVKFSDGRVITYLYDAGGNKLRMKTYASNGSLIKATDYVNGFVYGNGTLEFFGSPEGRVVKKGSTFEYQYAIADHQGNTRVVITSATPAASSVTATFEGGSGDQSGQFLNVVGSNVVTFTAANHTSGGSKVVRMNQTYKVGPTKSIKVVPGDKVDIEVWEYHEQSSGFGTTSTSLATMISMVAGAFGGVSGGGGESGMIYSGVNSAITAFALGGNQGANRPAAYLNYILFDRNYKVLDMGAQLAPATTMTKQKLSFATINVKEAGYLFVYLSYDNNSNNWVYFDDFKITHTPTNVIQYNEYYPFGLSTSNSWTREGSFNDYLYNAGSELNASSGWYETLFRGYDPVLGRFMQVDPMASALPSVSPYNFGLNDPVYYNDPMGDYVQKRIPPMYVGRGLNDIFGAAGGSGFYGSLMSGYSVERDARVMSRRDFLMFYGVADSYGRINESRRSEVTTAAATQSGTSLVWCSDCETGTVTGGTAVINGIYHSFTFVEKGAWIPNSATLSLNQAQGGPDPFREVFGLIAINGTNKFAFSYNVNDGTGKYVVGLDGVAIGYDYDPKTLAKTNPVILTQSLDLSRFNNTSGKRYPNYLVEAFKWGDLNAAFGQYTQKVWDAFKAGGGSVWELGPSHTVIGSTTYDITTYRFMTTVPISGANFTFFVDVMDYTPR